MRVRYAVMSTFALVVWGMVAGCGSGTNITDGSGLQGSYAGTYLAAWGAATEDGQLTLTIGPDGRMAGALVDNASGDTGTIVGTVRDDRRFEGVITYPTRTLNAVGNLTIGVNNRLVGVLDQRDGAGNDAGVFSLDCQAN